MWHLMRDYVISIMKTSSFVSSANTPNSSSSLTIYKSNFMAEPSHYTSYKNNIMTAICFISCPCSMTSNTKTYWRICQTFAMIACNT